MVLTALRTEIADPARLAALAVYDLIGGTTPRDERTGNAAPTHAGEDSRLTLDGVAQVAAAVCATPAAVVNLIDDRYQHQVAAHGVDPSVCTVQDSMCAAVLPQAATVVVPDASADDRFQSNPFVTGRLGSLRFYASAPLVAPSGYVLGTLCVFDDEPRSLTRQQQEALENLAAQVVGLLELQRHTSSLAVAHAELARSNELLSEFAGRISHDLKAPLTTVVGYAETLRSLLSSDQQRLSGFAARITAAGHRMRDLIDDVLRFAAAGGRPSIVAADLPGLVEEVAADLEPAIRAAEAQVSVDPATLTADRQQLRMLLQNLVGNAIAYRHPDRPCRVHISADPGDHSSSDGAYWRLEVADNGMGIPAEHRAKVVQPLYRLDRDHRTAGTGLGLAGCARVAQAHGGTLTVTGNEGGGTTITVTGRLDIG